MNNSMFRKLFFPKYFIVDNDIYYYIVFPHILYIYLININIIILIIII
jgi:hypothetical protein